MRTGQPVCLATKAEDIFPSTGDYILGFGWCRGMPETPSVEEEDVTCEVARNC